MTAVWSFVPRARRDRRLRDTVVIAPGITRSVWHRLDIVARFVDGPANDTVEFALDGIPLGNPAGGTRFRTFEAFYACPDSRIP